MKRSYETELYIEDRKRRLADFHVALEESKRKKPSIPGTLLGLNYKEYAIITVFWAIIEQENFIDSLKKEPPSAILLEEEKILEYMVKEAKLVFKDSYDKLYQHERKLRKC